MTNDKPGFVLDNQYSVPPEFAYSWLTDFHEDDGQRYFGMTGPGKVGRAEGATHLEANMPFGVSKMTVTPNPPDHWTADGEFFSKSGKRMAKTRIVESVRAEGAGTRHHAEFYLWPEGFGAKLMFAMGRGRMTRDMSASFARIKTDLEAEYRATHG
jgi:hypothetical protein